MLTGLRCLNEEIQAENSITHEPESMIRNAYRIFIKPQS